MRRHERTVSSVRVGIAVDNLAERSHPTSQEPRTQSHYDGDNCKRNRQRHQSVHCPHQARVAVTAIAISAAQVSNRASLSTRPARRAARS